MRLMTITMEVSDEEATNLLNRMGERGNASFDGETATTPAAPATPEAPAELDANGVPWNALYHAGTKGKNKNGTWKALRGMDDATKDAAEAYEASFENADSEPEAPAAPVAPAAPPAAPAPTPPAAPVAPTAVPEAPATPAPVSFEELTAGFTEVIGRIGQEALMAKLGQIYADAGVPADGASLQTNETQRAQVLAAIRAL